MTGKQNKHIHYKTDSELIFEKSAPGEEGFYFRNSELNDIHFSQHLRRKKEPSLPELSENRVVRHYTNLSIKNYGVDNGFYPLGSCTMKYNPKMNERAASYPSFTGIHPGAPDESVQGSLELIYNLEQMLSEICGMDGFTLHPSAGAHGELTGLMIIKAWLEKNGADYKDEILVPDSAHGTNPASAALCGFKIVQVESNEEGILSPETLKQHITENTAGLMLTNPSTLGLFEPHIIEIADMIHKSGGLLYYDGANMNANLGITRPGDMGFDVVHLNLHKTFSTPHGGGGPGAGPVGVCEKLVPFLPSPRIKYQNGIYKRVSNSSDSVGNVISWQGNFLVAVRAYTWILFMGASGLKKVSESAVLKANYLKEKLKRFFHLPYNKLCKHEFVLSGPHNEHNVTTFDLAKRLLDFGYHPPTVYFPLIVKEALMIEPTESESKEELDRFINVMTDIADEINKSPDLLKNAPHNTPVKRVDEVMAARKPVLTWHHIKSDPT